MSDARGSRGGDDEEAEEGREEDGQSKDAEAERGPPKWKAVLGVQEKVVEEEAIEDGDAEPRPSVTIKRSPAPSVGGAADVSRDGKSAEGEAESEERDELESTPVAEKDALPMINPKREETPLVVGEDVKPKAKRTRRKKAEDDDAPTPSKRRRGELALSCVLDFTLTSRDARYTPCRWSSSICSCRGSSSSSPSPRHVSRRWAV